jgi:hypothetical protein
MELALSQNQEALLNFRLKPTRVRTLIETGPATAHKRFEADLHISSSGLAVGFERIAD